MISALKRHLKCEYTVLNGLILASYFLIYRRQHTDSNVDIKMPFSSGKSSFQTVHSAGYASFESQVAASLILTVVARSYRSTSLDATVATLLAYTQLFVLICTFVSDMVSSIFYLLGFGLVFLLCNEPTYNEEDKVEPMTAKLFIEKCMTKDSNSKEKGDAHVVYLYTGWSSRCRHAYSLFSDLSNRYATDKLHFFKLDVGVWPHIAKQLGVDLSSVSSQLPTVVCFEGGEEVGRVPAGTRQSLKGVAKWTFSKMDLIKGLQLDARYAQSMGNASTTASDKETKKSK